jgi:hypothetical protein
MSMKSVEDLDVFRLSHEINIRLYEVTKGFSSEEKSALVC